MVFCCFSIQKEGIGLIVRLVKCSPAKEINQRGGVIREIGNAMAHFFKSLSLGALMRPLRERFFDALTAVGQPASAPPQAVRAETSGSVSSALWADSRCFLGPCASSSPACLL